MSALDHQSTLKDPSGRLVGVKAWKTTGATNGSAPVVMFFYVLQPTRDGKDYQDARRSKGYPTPAARDVAMQAAFDRAVRLIAKKWGAL